MASQQRDEPQPFKKMNPRTVDYWLQRSKAFSIEKRPDIKTSFHLFFSYAHQDEALRDKLEDHLSVLKYSGRITTWHAKEISAGQHIIEQIDIHLNTADIILLLISAHFLASEYCYGKEMMRALERYEQKDARVIPILLRPVFISDAPFVKLKMLPSNGKPVTSWRDRELAFVDIVQGINSLISPWPSPLGSAVLHSPLQRERIIQQAPTLTTKEAVRELFVRERDASLDWIEIVSDAGHLSEQDIQELKKELPLLIYYLEALRRYEDALRKNNDDITAYRGKGLALVGLKLYDDALITFENAIERFSNTMLFVGKAETLFQMQRYEEAIIIYQHALDLDASNALAYSGLKEIFTCLGEMKEAQNIEEQAHHLGYDV
jgi:hypothetical protein